MGEINAAITVNSLLHSSRFDLTSTYFMVAGIAGINPEVATIGSVAFARYAVQVALQHELDIRDLPGNYSTGLPYVDLWYRGLRAEPELTTHGRCFRPQRYSG
jgi:purine nucleoside permease